MQIGYVVKDVEKSGHSYNSRSPSQKGALLADFREALRAGSKLGKVEKNINPSEEVLQTETPHKRHFIALKGSYSLSDPARFELKRSPKRSRN